MAIASRTTRVIEKVVTEEIPDGCVVTLSEDELRALAVVLRRVAGVPTSTPRGLTDAVLGSLAPFIDNYGLDLDAEYSLTGSLCFESKG